MKDCLFKVTVNGHVRYTCATATK